MILPDINLHQAELHTNDGDFKRFPGLRWSNPLLEM